MKYFYTHLVQIEEIVTGLEELGLTGEQKKHLASLVDSSIHGAVLNLVLDSLNDQDKKVFIDYLKKDNHDKTWEFLNQRMGSIEEKIRLEINRIKEKLHKDMKEAKNLKKEI